jgi:hypothetical protein
VGHRLTEAAFENRVSGPSACPSCPLFSGRRDVGTHDGRVEHLNQVR